MRRAECACGRLSAACEGEPVRVSVCHCLACKRRTGSAFSWNARWPRAAVAVTGEAASFTRTGDEGGRCTHHFCPACGVSVWYEIDMQPETVAIPVGAFADPAFPAPTVSVYDPFRRCAWVEIGGDGLERWG